MNNTVLPRRGEAEEIGYTALFLASDESSYITGTDIVVDGARVRPGGCTGFDHLIASGVVSEWSEDHFESEQDASAEICGEAVRTTRLFARSAPAG